MDLQENETLTFNDVVSRSQLKPTRNQTYQKPEDHYAEDDSLADAAAGFVAGLMVGNQTCNKIVSTNLEKKSKCLMMNTNLNVVLNLNGTRTNIYQLNTKIVMKKNIYRLAKRNFETQIWLMTHITPDERRDDGDIDNMNDF